MKRSILLAVAMAWTASMGAAAQQPSPGPAVPQGLDALMRAMGGAPGKAVATLVDFRELKALLPADLPDMKRTSINAERSGAMGMNVSLAEATYANDAGGSIDLKLTDMGGLGGLVGMARAGWAMAELDRETESGYERTLSYKGHKAMRRYDRSSKQGRMQILVGGRFMVEVGGSGVPDSAIETAVARINLDKLAALKPKPVE